MKGPTYRAGETVEVRFSFRSQGLGGRSRLTAEFRNAKDPEAVIGLTGAARRVSRNRDYRGQLSGAITYRDKPGRYQCVKLVATGWDDLDVPFEAKPDDLAFTVERTGISPAEITSRPEWNKG